jgi:hypothetical protein
MKDYQTYAFDDAEQELRRMVPLALLRSGSEVYRPLRHSSL